MISSVLLLALATLAQLTDVNAHGVHRSMSHRELSRRQLQANRRHVVARNCAPQIAAFNEKRKLARRSYIGGHRPNRNQRHGAQQLAASVSSEAASSSLSAIQPHTTSITNLTCVTAPEVTEGPYYLNNDVIRQDLREDQGGILLSLDIGVLDTSTCEPLPAALVEIWACNATGSYSGFTTASLDPPSGDPPTGSPSGSMSVLPTGTESPSGSMSVQPTGTGSAGSAPSGAPGGGGGAPGGGSTTTDNLNFLRGGYETDSNGIVTFKTIYPGFYTGRAIHIHTMVHQNVTYNANGTFVSRSGSLVHIGQMFIDDDLNNQVMALEPYNSTTQTRTYNNEDSILAEENANGYNAFIETELIGDSLGDGIFGYITLTVDSTAEYEVTSYNYHEASSVLSESSSETSTSTSSETFTSTSSLLTSPSASPSAEADCDDAEE